MKRLDCLLVNPWITDFAAYDFWMRPLGLLKIAAMLEQSGCRVHLVDCLDRADRLLLKKYPNLRDRSQPYGCGHSYKTPFPKPPACEGFSRPYYQYGMPDEIFEAKLKKVKSPSVILMTCAMTFWYPGLAKAADTVRRIFPGVPIVLGGVYATLCPGHARTSSGADIIFEGAGMEKIRTLLGEILGVELKDPLQYPLPYKLYDRPAAAAVQTMTGCPFDCAYCASRIMHGNSVSFRDPSDVIREVSAYERLGVKDVAFYDDALFYRSLNHIKPILRGLIQKKIQGVRFHTPNAVHAAFVDAELAGLLRDANFRTLRLSLESVDAGFMKDSSSNKVSGASFEEAVLALKSARFNPKFLAAYILMGHPKLESSFVLEAMKYCAMLGIAPELASFSPIPGTVLWNELKSKGLVNDGMDPVLHGNSIYPHYAGIIDIETERRLRKGASLFAYAAEHGVDLKWIFP